MSVVKLISKSNNGKHWGARDTLEAALDDLKTGRIKENDRVVVLVVGPPGTGEFNSTFLQCGLSASEMIMMLEIAKLDIYTKQMKGN